MIKEAYLLSAAYLYCEEHKKNDLFKEIGLSNRIDQYIKCNAISIISIASGREDKGVFKEMENVVITPQIIGLALMFYQEHAKEHPQGLGALGTILLKFLNLRAAIETHHIFGHRLVCDEEDRLKANVALNAIEPIVQGETAHDFSAMTKIVETIVAQTSHPDCNTCGSIEDLQSVTGRCPGCGRPH